MIAPTNAQLHLRTAYVQCDNCGMHQQRDLNNPCIYCGSKQFHRVYEEFDPENFHEMW